MSQHTPTPRRHQKTEFRRAADWIRYLADLGTFEHDDVPASCPLSHLRRIGATRTVGTATRTVSGAFGSTTNEIHRYRVDADALGYVEGLDRKTLLPCGHAGLENHGEFFTCQFPPCDERFGRGEVGET